MSDLIEQSHSNSIEKAILTGSEITIGKYALNQTGLYKITKEGNKENVYEVSPPILVEERFQDYLDDKMYMNLKFWVNNRFISKEIPMIELTNLLPFISQYGMPLTKTNAAMVQSFLIQQQKTSPLSKIYSNIGFFPLKEDGQLVFGLSKAIGDTDNALKWFKGKSRFDIRTKGTLEAWRDVVKNRIIGHAGLEFMIGVGCSAVISGYYNQIGQDNDSLVINLVGRGTTGKTTGSKLGISIFGNPIKSKDGLFQTWNATENGIIKKLIGNYGVPILIDEFSMNTLQDTTNIIYRFAEGRDRLRGNDKNGLHDVGTWATTIITNGENSIIDKSNKNLGAEVRLLEFKNVRWTVDAEHAEAIAQVIHKNYGVAGIQFVEYLATDWTVIETKVEEWTTRLKITLPKSDVKDRLAFKYGMILAALELAGEAFNLTFSLKEVEAFIIQNEQQLVIQRDTADLMYNEVINDVRENFMQFIIDDVPQQRGYTCRGKIITPRQSNQSYYRVNYLKSGFEELITKHNLSNKETLIRALKKKPYFNHESDRPTIRTNIEGMGKIVTYEFHIQKEELDTWLV